MHSFWHGEEDAEEHEGLLFIHYTEAQLEKAFQARATRSSR